MKQGQYYLAQSNNQCPFCQQQISNDLDEKLKKYFDKTFEQDISALESLINSYNNSYQQLKNDIQSLNSPFLNNQEIEIRLSKLDYIFDKKFSSAPFLFLKYFNYTKETIIFKEGKPFFGVKNFCSVFCDGCETVKYRLKLKCYIFLFLILIFLFYERIFCEK